MTTTKPAILHPAEKHDAVRLKAQFRVEVLRTTPQVEAIRSFWESWPGTRDSDIDFYLAVLRSSPAAVRPHVIVVYRDQIPETILVGRIDCRAVHLPLGYLNIAPEATILFFVQGPLRGDESPDHIELLIAEICRNLAAGEADLADLNLLRTDSHLYRLARTLPGLLCRDHICASQPHFTVQIPDSSAAFYSGLSQRVRKNQRCQANRLVRDFCGDVKLRCFREVAEIDELSRTLDEISKTTYQRALGFGFVDNVEMRERLHFEAEKGWLRGYVLYVANRACCFFIGDVYQGTFWPYYTGYDPEFARYSPGMFTLLKVIEDLCERKQDQVTLLDFGSGYAQYKDFVGSPSWSEAPVWIFAPSVRGVGLNLLKATGAGIHQTVSRTLQRIGLLQSVKKIWRTYVAGKAKKEI